jgi:hypothetical protein
MAGFVLDIYIEFFFRTAMLWLNRSAASDWPVMNSVVVESKLREPGIGCTVVIIRYQYRNADVRCEGTHKQPFILANYADAYLRRFPCGAEFPVRINPKNRAESIQAEWPTFTRA